MTCRRMSGTVGGGQGLAGQDGHSLHDRRQRVCNHDSRRSRGGRTTRLAPARSKRGSTATRPIGRENDRTGRRRRMFQGIDSILPESVGCVTSRSRETVTTDRSIAGTILATGRMTIRKMGVGRHRMVACVRFSRKDHGRGRPACRSSRPAGLEWNPMHRTSDCSGSSGRSSRSAPASACRADVRLVDRASSPSGPTTSAPSPAARRSATPSPSSTAPTPTSGSPTGGPSAAAPT